MKAEALAARYGMAWGVEIRAITARFDKSLLPNPYGLHRGLTVLVGCVDNAAARNAIADALRSANFGEDQRPACWWLDCGNSWASGQVLLGSATNVRQLAQAFALPKKCSALPAPSLQHPELLRPKAEETDQSSLPCEEILAATPNLTVNQMTIAADYLTGLLLGQDLRCFATYFDLSSKSVRSSYITPEVVSTTLGTTPQELFVHRGRRGKSS
jgi:hypothetical protein